MSAIATSRGLVAALKAEGYAVPENCREARVIMSVDTALYIQFEVYLTQDDIAKIGKALQRVGEGAK